MWGSVSIDRELIGRLIGPKGASIQALEASTGARLAIFDDAGSVQVRSRTPCTAELTNGQLPSCWRVTSGSPVRASYGVYVVHATRM